MRRDWPIYGAALLSLAALIEVSARGGSPVDLVLALALALPLALARVQPVAAVCLIVAAGFLAVLTQHRPPIVGTVALVTIAAAEGIGLIKRAWAEAAQRDASQREVADTLLEHVARGERARIARELHDVVAHHISMIAVQAEAARLTTPGMPPEGARRLVSIGDTARAALTEMRRLLGVLREDAGTEATRAPQPGLRQLIELLDETRAVTPGGARLIVSGRIGPLDPGVELTAYRIVQEALTNARRHAPGAAVDVELHYGQDTLRVRVRDNGPGAPAANDPRPGPRPGAGHGLSGMFERTAMVGGTLRTGPTPMGGFMVEATLPRSPE